MIFSDLARTEVDALLQAAVERRDIPGVVAVVANRDRVIYRGAFGMLDDQGTIPLPADAIFRIASMTKPVTSVAIMMLREQGLLELDDSIGEYVPDLVGREVIVAVNESDGSYTTRPAKREITIRDLLTNTAGFGYDFSSETLCVLCRGGERSPRNLPLLHDPGSQWTYGMSMAVLGEAIERITSESLDLFFETRIFQPLGLNDTGFYLEREKHHRLIALFQRGNGELIGEPWPASYEPFVAGDAGLLSTGDDYIRFLLVLLNMGQVGNTRLLTNQSVNELTMNQLGSLKVQKQPGAIPEVSNSFPLGAGRDTFGLGFQLKEDEEDNARSPGSYSWAGLFNTHFWADPQQGIAAVLLMQLLPFYDDLCIQLLKDFENRVYRNLG
jgi:methyl acetate hydrolase